MDYSRRFYLNLPTIRYMIYIRKITHTIVQQVSDIARVRVNDFLNAFKALLRVNLYIVNNYNLSYFALHVTRKLLEKFLKRREKLIKNLFLLHCLLFKLDVWSVF